MKKPFNRRMFLRGAAGFTLALPFLPSLAPRGAEAQSRGTRRFVAFGTQHGGIWQEAMYPSTTTLTNTSSYGHQIRRGALAATVQGDRASLSPILTADATVLTPALVQKMNVLRGLDVTFYLAHHRGGHLGNYAENDGNGTDGNALQAHIPTIDQVMAWSPSFYPDLSTILERSLVIGTDAGMSANWSSPASKTGEVQNISPQANSLALFNSIFVPEQDPTEARPPIVDLVLEDYKRLRESNRRLSAADKQRLDDHLELLDELQRKVNVAASCSDIQPPTQSSGNVGGSDFGVNPDKQALFWQLLCDVVHAALVCDTCRIASLFVTSTHSDYDGDWHQDIAHQANLAGWPANVPLPSATGPSPQSYIATGHQRFFEDVYMYLVHKLDETPDGTGGSLLDSCLVQWTQESGAVTHDPIELPIITAGGADGFFQTGQYCDYRNLQSPAHVSNSSGHVASHTGLVYNQWLGTVLQAMGLDPSEYESGPYGGYGQVITSSETWYAGYNKYPSSVLNSMGEILPFMT
jgi:hypothetical protein